MKKDNQFNQSKYIQQFMKDNVTVKKVSFNNANDIELLNWISNKKFSTYVKKLISADMCKCKD